MFSHVKIGETEETIVGGRVPAASADVLIACDLLVAASPEGLSLYAKDRTHAFGNSDFAPTADFVTSRDVRFDSGAMARRVRGATKTFDACPAQHLAESQFGDAIYANMIMVGFAWQRGVIPVSSRALYRAIKLNGVDADANLAAFELGRRVAHDPTSVEAKEDKTPTPDTMPLEELIAHRIGELTAYQNVVYAQAYADKVARVRNAEVAVSGPDGALPLTRAAAINLYKLMAYKDEYEVARLYTDGRFKAELAGTFKGGQAKVWLSPPLLAPKGADGKPKKVAFGGWMLDVAFPLMARMKGLRGGPLDVFGKTEERRMEHGLIASYQVTLDRLAAGLSPESLPLAVKIAEIPQQIRGYGHVKDASVAVAKTAEDKLWAQWGAA